MTMPYRVQFLDRSADLVDEVFADARNDVAAIESTADMDWPRGAVVMRVLDVDGRKVQSRLKVTREEQTKGMGRVAVRRGNSTQWTQVKAVVSGPPISSKASRAF